MKREICKDHRRWLNRNDCTNVWTITKAITNNHNTRMNIETFREWSHLIERERERETIKINEGRRNKSFFNPVFTTITDPVESIDTLLRSRSTHPTRFQNRTGSERTNGSYSYLFYSSRFSLWRTWPRIDPRIVDPRGFLRNDTQIPTTQTKGRMKCSVSFVSHRR